MKEPLLLLPGMMCDARVFAHQINVFSAERPVMVAPLIERASFEYLVEDLLASAPPQFALAGLSMGGIAAMEIMRQAPERVTRLALMDTNPLADPAERIAIRDAQIETVLNGGLRSVIRDEMKPNYLSPRSDSSSILALCMAMAESMGVAAFVDQSRALQQRRDQCDTLRKIRIPTLILCGEDDALCPVERHELMHQLVEGSQLTVVPGAGHLPQLEQAECVTQVLVQWLND